MQTLVAFASQRVDEKMQGTTESIFRGLPGVPREAPLVDGFLRRIWQEYHENMIPTADVEPFFDEFFDKELPVTPWPAPNALHASRPP